MCARDALMVDVGEALVSSVFGWSYGESHVKLGDRNLRAHGRGNPGMLQVLRGPSLSTKAGGTDGSSFDGAWAPGHAAGLKWPERGEYAWAQLMSQYVKSGQNRQALILYEEMRDEGVEPKPHTFVPLLKACCHLQDLESVKRIQGEVVRHGCERDPYVGTMLVTAYTKCGSLEGARMVLEGMPHRDVASWTAIILGYAQLENGEEALHLYEQMKTDGAVPNARTFVAALKACSSIVEIGERDGVDGLLVRRRSLERVRIIHRDVGTRMLESNVFVANMLVDAYSKCGSVDDARLVFERMSVRTVVSWTAMIFGYARNEKGEEALQLFARMRQEGVVPNEQTYVGALKACSTLAEAEDKKGGGERVLKRTILEVVTRIHADAERGKSELDIFVGTMLVDAYAKCGSLENARRVFEDLPRRDAASWTAMILGYSQMGEGEEALQLYSRMRQEGIIPDQISYIGALQACRDIAESCERLHSGGDRTRAKRECLEVVRGIHTEAIKRNAGSDLFLGNMLVDTYSKCGSLMDARQVFESMHDRDVVSWNSMIMSYSQMEESDEALQLYGRMQQEGGVVPNERTYVAALNACGSLAGLEAGRKIHAQIVKSGLDTGPFITSSLIDMYAKCSSMMDARQVFEAECTRDVVAWNALIGGYAHQGQSDVVFHLFERMKQEGVQPDEITFLGMLNACCHAGLVQRGQTYFDAMSREFGIPPTVEHHNCMVDLLGRAGQVEKALETANMMPLQPDLAVWKCILSACQMWGNVVVARQAFESAMELDRSDPAVYILMSNIYAAGRLPQDANEIQAKRVASGAWKEPGRSCWMDMAGKVHVFVARDPWH